MSAAPERRAYDSGLRRARAAEKRTALLDAFVDQLASGPESLSVPDAAVRAGVALRTAYHHFPNREAQLAAVAKHIETRLVGGLPPPRGADDLPGLARDLYRAFGENEGLVRAQAATGVARDIRRVRRQERLAAIDAAVAGTGGPAKESRWAAALLKHLMSADAGIALKDEFGVEPDDAGDAIAWAAAVFIAWLRAHPGAHTEQDRRME